MKKNILLFSAFFLLIFSACSSQPTMSPTPIPTPIRPLPTAAATQPAVKPTLAATSTVSGFEKSTVIEQMVAAMTPAEKIGQVMVVGFDGTTLEAPLREMIESYHIGGVILFARNVESPAQLAKLVRDIQENALKSGNPGLIVAIDQEGGRVARLTEAQGFIEVPGAMAIAATNNKENARAIAQLLAGEMKLLGINADFAPVLDVNNNPDNPVIGIRSFGSQPDTVSQFGVAFIQSLQSSGVMAFGKHFPGHGDTGVDSHISLPVVTADLERLDQIELVPFKAAIAANVAGIMSAHVAFPAIEPNPMLPATLSPRVLTDLLRIKLGYGGLVITDSLEMGALGSLGYTVPSAAATALQAGADLLLFNRDHDLHKAAFQLILDKINGGQIPLQRLNDAVSRILTAKANYKILEPALPDPDHAATIIGQHRDSGIVRTVAENSITLLRDLKGLLPIGDDEKILVVETPAGLGLGQLLGKTYVSIGEQPASNEIQAVLSMANDGRKVVLITTDAARNSQQVKLVKALQKTNSPLVIVAARGPYDLMAFPEVGTCLVTYGAPPPTLRALVEILTGRLHPNGHLPVSLPGLYQVGDGLTGLFK